MLHLARNGERLCDGLRMNLYNMTTEHWIFIPSVFALGWVVGFLMGVSKAQS
jgi:hypothetical protein